MPYLRLRGAKIGKGSKISIFSLFKAENIIIGESTKIAPFTLVRCRSIRLGNRVQIKATAVIDTVKIEIGHDSIIMEQVVVGGMKTSRSSLSIGARVKIFPYSFINPTEPIVIEDEVGIGGANYIFTHGSWQPVLDGYPVAFGPVTIRKGVWLPWRVFVLPNVEIGENCTIGASSVINKSIPPNCFAAGVPAKVLSSDGSHLRVNTKSEKLLLVEEILWEMFDFMRFEGDQVEVASTSYGLSAKVTQGKSHLTIEYVSSGHVGEIRSDVMVSFQEIEAQKIQDLVRSNCSWLDIERRQCFFGRSDKIHEVRDFFGRYGIRFSVWGE